MPYFDEVRAELNDLLAWADVRHEQGVKVAPRLAGLRRQLRAASTLAILRTWAYSQRTSRHVCRLSWCASVS